ncbi:GAF domain-containing sensor histidine kinase [Fodinibius saliphilus]|uniref:GAF domain-containing sensor histidine kinase n=1 Tax=Fodinibius saliphilus TaxID=1920650 RepID=UPI0011089892|nr:GAF domain-containing sensor histidine kinase [Fodinibius saliphilus]
MNRIDEINPLPVFKGKVNEHIEETQQRIEELASLNIDLEDSEQNLEPFVELGKYITDSPICLINILDAYNQWTVAGELGDNVMAKEKSLCQYTIQQSNVFEIANLSRDDRFKDRFYVKKAPALRYYCGVPITTSRDVDIGSICVLDTKEKSLSDTQKEQLQHLADIIVKQLEITRKFEQAASGYYELKDSFHKLSHDLRSPINGIVGIAETLKQEDETPTKEDLSMIKECAESVIEEIDSMLSIVDNREQNPKRRREIQLKKLADKIERLYKPQAKKKNISLQFNYEVGEEAEIGHQTFTKLIQIVGNLVANAIKFSNGGGTVTVCFQKSPEACLEITVTDDGIGMNVKQIKAFNSGDLVKQSEGTEGEASFGVGLQHVRTMIEELGGKISVSSEEGEGSCFTISLMGLL